MNANTLPGQRVCDFLAESGIRLRQERLTEKEAALLRRAKESAFSFYRAGTSDAFFMSLPYRRLLEWK